jgi:hypothetical protein
MTGHSHRSFLLRRITRKSTSPYLSLSALLWLCLVALLFGNITMTSILEAGTWYDWGDI